MSFVITGTQKDLLKKIFNYIQPNDNLDVQLKKLDFKVAGSHDSFPPGSIRFNDMEVCLLACVAANGNAWVNKETFKQQCACYMKEVGLPKDIEDFFKDFVKLSQMIENLIKRQVLREDKGRLEIMPIANRPVYCIPPIRPSLFSAGSQQAVVDTKVADVAMTDRVTLNQQISDMLEAITQRSGVEAANKIKVKITQKQRLFTASSAFEKAEGFEREMTGIAVRAFSRIK